LKKGREQVEIVALYEELGSYRAVSALAGCDHKTVKRYVELAGELGQLAPPRRRAGHRLLPRADRREGGADAGADLGAAAVAVGPRRGL
jgi:hypothetical protein